MPSGSLEGGLRTVMVIIRHISSDINIATLWQVVKARPQNQVECEKVFITKSRKTKNMKNLKYNRISE